MAQQVACISSCPALPSGYFLEGQVSPRLQIPSEPWEPRGGGSGRPIWGHNHPLPLPRGARQDCGQ